MPVVSRNAKGKTPAKTPSKNNASILAFFKKVDSPAAKERDDSIFLSQGSGNNDHGVVRRQRVSLGFDAEALGLEDDMDVDVGVDVDLYGGGEERFNESSGSVKRRRILDDDREIADSEAEEEESQLSAFRPGVEREMEVVDMTGISDTDEDEKACTRLRLLRSPRLRPSRRSSRRRNAGRDRSCRIQMRMIMWIRSRFRRRRGLLRRGS